VYHPAITGALVQTPFTGALDQTPFKPRQDPADVICVIPISQETHHTSIRHRMNLLGDVTHCLTLQQHFAAENVVREDKQCSQLRQDILALLMFGCRLW